MEIRNEKEVLVLLFLWANTKPVMFAICWNLLPIKHHCKYTGNVSTVVSMWQSATNISEEKQKYSFNQ